MRSTEQQGKNTAYEKVGYELPSTLVKATKQIGIEEKILLKHLVEDALRDLISLYQSQKESVGYTDNGDRHLFLFRDHIENAQHTPTYTMQDHDLLQKIIKLRKAHSQTVTVIERMISSYVAEVEENEALDSARVREKAQRRDKRHPSGATGVNGAYGSRSDHQRNDFAGEGDGQHLQPLSDTA